VNGNDAENRRAIIAMARKPKLELIAEGVETLEQLILQQPGFARLTRLPVQCPAVTESAFLQILMSITSTRAS